MACCQPAELTWHTEFVASRLYTGFSDTLAQSGSNAASGGGGSKRRAGTEGGQEGRKRGKGNHGEGLQRRAEGGRQQGRGVEDTSRSTGMKVIFEGWGGGGRGHGAGRW